MVELNKFAFTGEFHLDLHGSSINLNRLAIGHIKLISMLFKKIFLQCIYSCTVFILYLLTKSICFVAIHAEIIHLYLFPIKCKFY